MFTKDLISEKQDMRYLKWSRVRKSSGTAGSYLKAYDDSGRKIYYKLSCYDLINGITGHECINELIVDRLLNLLEINHIHYQLIYATVLIDSKEYDTWICASEDFKETGDSKSALDEYFAIMQNYREDMFEFCIRMGWEEYIYDMILVDYIILNRDRHGANIEVIKRKSGKTELAPLFDHGLSLVFNCHTEEELKEFDPMEDKPVQCVLGSRSAADNLKLIPKGKRPKIRQLNNRDRAYLFAGLGDALPKSFQDKIWQMITERIAYYESL